jgi:hypothetical protein
MNGMDGVDNMDGLRNRNWQLARRNIDFVLRRVLNTGHHA